MEGENGCHGRKSMYSHIDSHSQILQPLSAGNFYFSSMGICMVQVQLQLLLSDSALISTLWIETITTSQRAAWPKKEMSKFSSATALIPVVLASRTCYYIHYWHYFSFISYITVKVICGNFCHINVNTTILPCDVVILWQVKFISLLMVIFALIISHPEGVF